MTNTLKVNTDGGARGNPGPAASGFVIYKERELIKKDYKYLGIATNNQAEYSGVLFALTYLSNNKIILENINLINFYLDSELVVKQLQGLYKIKNNNLIKLHGDIKSKLLKIGVKTNFYAVPRSQNHEADSLVNECLDVQLKV